MARDGMLFVPERLNVSYGEDQGPLGAWLSVTAVGWVPRSGALTLFSLPVDSAEAVMQVWETWVDGFYSSPDTYWAQRGDHAIRDLPTWITCVLDDALPDVWRAVRGQQVAA
ncbi:hypothetical protein [Actinomyces provencensis]|uniref:hypothetical protein n=1 Tax=Actinomyces provencensis TaxID=1720198 RepID=UPI0011774AD6|nr:hypothetical protein [Actinomyces provencensis]